MKVGDFVIKVAGTIGVGKSGIVVKIYNTESKQGYPIVEAFSDGKLVKWAAHLLEVVE